ncbi:GGDEF domain-containing protein [Agrobacterium tumefaciens]|nr:GGDEF domain-containing protein [Agrobacterium tumefaciens]
MPITLLDWSVPATIFLCGLALIAIKYLGFATIRWGYALTCLSIGYAIMLMETDYATPFKQILEDNFIVASVILACRALDDRVKLNNNLAFELAVLFTTTITVAISRTMFGSARLETLFVQACCAVVLWRGYARFLPLAATKSDKILSFTFLLLAMVLTGQCLLYIAASETGHLVGEWRTSVWGNLIQFTGLIGSITLVLSVLVATAYDTIEKYRRYANLDPLTGLLNRRGLDEFLASARGKTATGIILADIDQFKAINDRFGHSFGDLVISRFGALLRSHITVQGCVARLGGEEFAVLLPDASLDDAIATADKMRRSFEAERWPRDGKECEFTASFGVTLVEVGEALSTAFERADQFLYAAKRSGRNRVAAAKQDYRLLLLGRPADDNVVYIDRVTNESIPRPGA